MRWLVLAALLPLQANAQQAVDAPLCDRIKRSIGFDEISGLSARRTFVEDGACVFEGVEVQTPGQFQPDFDIRRLTLAADGLRGYMEDGVLPTSLDVSVDGLRFLYEVSDDPFFTYLVDVQQARNLIDIEVSAFWDEAARELVLSRVFVDFQGDNEFLLSGRASNVSLGTIAQMQGAVGSMVLDELSLNVESNGLFEWFAFGPLAALLLEGSQDPEADVAALKVEGQAIVAALPGDIFVGETRAALSALVEDMPTPGGTLTLDVVAEPGIGALRFAPLALLDGPPSLEDIWGVLNGVTVDVTYDRVPF